MFRHTPIIGSDPHKSSPTHLDTLSYREQHFGMDKLFPKRSIFRDAVNTFRKVNNVTREQVAAMLDLHDGGLRCLMYDKRTGVSLDTLQNAAQLFHRPITDFVDDPGSPQGDIDAAAWADATPRDRILATAIFADLLSLSEEDKEAAYQLWRHGLTLAIAKQKAEAKKR